MEYGHHLHSTLAGVCLSGGDDGLVQSVCPGVGSVGQFREQFLCEHLRLGLAARSAEIFNSDQGSQFTSEVFTDKLRERGIRISMDGRGRALDNIFVERLWRSVKYEEVYLKDYRSVMEAVQGLRAYFEFYNGERLHQSLNYQTPEAVYRQGLTMAAVTTLN